MGVVGRTASSAVHLMVKCHLCLHHSPVTSMTCGGVRCTAAEDDVDTSAKPATSGRDKPSPASSTTEGSGSSRSEGIAAANAGQQPSDLAGAVAVGRTYSYVTEATCDKHVGIFLKAIDTVARLPGQGFAAIKVTWLPT